MKKTDHSPSGAVRVFRGIIVCLLGAAVGYFVYATTVNPESRFPFKLGLDLAGGSHLVYEADVSNIADGDVDSAMSVLRDVIERRTNVFGVSEPNVQVERSSVVSGEKSQRLVVELPGVTNVDEAVREIGKTPSLEFKLVDEAVLAEMAKEQQPQTEETPFGEVGGDLAENEPAPAKETAKDPFVVTGLTGRYLERATLEFGNGQQGSLSNEPIVGIKFNDEGAKLFEKITRENVGSRLAIFLDGQMVSEPRINEAISGGSAVISGNFTPDTARELVRNLNFGALPVPIELVSTQTIGASLGEDALHAGMMAGLVGFLILSIFLILWYRIPGLVAVFALCMYVVLMLALFKFVPVVLTAAGIAGFILSIGLAVDANVLIAERMKEELKAGKETEEAIAEGFARAWLAIRDSNIAHLIAGAILFWFGTSLVKGFALVLGIGVFVSMLSAITISRTLLLALRISAVKKVGRFLMGSGFSF